MLDNLLAPIFLILFFLAIFLFLYLGIYIAQYQAGKKIATEQSSGLLVMQGAIFALLGLIVAFTFSTASHRFDVRRYLLTKESNAIRTAYLRIDFIDPAQQKIMRQLFKEYLFSEIATYKKITDKKAYELEHDKVQNLQQKIWKIASEKSCMIEEQKRACLLFIRSLNTLFEIARTRYANEDIHPPLIVFLLLSGLAMLGALLAGFDIGEKKKANYLFILSYSFVLALTVYIIIDLEFPRLGFITADSFDGVLVEDYQMMEQQ